MIKLAEATLGTKAIHSSQIHGFKSGKLRSHFHPKLMMALGELNLASKAAPGRGNHQLPLQGCPGTLSKHWQDKTHG